MDLIRQGSSKSLATASSINEQSTKLRRKVLNEDVFITELDRIIERDFFPNLASLRKRNAPCAQQTPTFCKLTQQSHYVDSFETPTPAATTTGPLSDFRTPSTSQSSSARADVILCTIQGNTAAAQQEQLNRQQFSLDEFLNSYTSEDNASFEQIMREAEKRHRIRHPWMYQDEEASRKQLKQEMEVPSITQQAANSEKHANERNSQKLLSWPFRNRNSVMYNPDAALYTAEERARLQVASQRQQICYENTRFLEDDRSKLTTEQQIVEAARRNALAQKGKINFDGKEIHIDDEVRINGWSLVPSTPTIEPGIEATPLMTWGEIEGTPLNLDRQSIAGDETPASTSSQLQQSDSRLGLQLPEHKSGLFKIPDISSREKLALSLTDRIAKHHRDKKRTAVEQFSRQCTPGTGDLFSSSMNSPRTPRLNEMSPAAQQFARKTLGLGKATIDKTKSGSGLAVDARSACSPYPSFSKSMARLAKSGRTPHTPRTPIQLQHKSKEAALTSNSSSNAASTK